MNTKLMIVEGIPGSGKTTTADHLCHILTQRGIEHVLFKEGDLNHPADFESVACLTEEQYQELSGKYTELSSLLHEMTEMKDGYYFIAYAKHKNEKGDSFPEVLYQELGNYDVYNNPIEQYAEVILNRWKSFVEVAVKGDKVYIFECAFLQNPMSTFMARDDRPYEEISQFFSQLARVIEKLNPVVLYYHQDNVKETLDRVMKTRSKEWFDFVTWYWTGQEYGKNRGLSGYEGVITFLENRKRLELEILDYIGIETLILDNTSYDWEKRFAEIQEFLLTKWSVIN